MKIGIIYSSVTGNTEKIAIALKNRILDAELLKLEDIHNLDKFQILIIGYWVNKGTANVKIQKLLKSIVNKKIAVFGTSGQYPESSRAKKYLDRVKILVEENNVYLGGFICQGKIKEERTEKRMKILKGNSHYLDNDGYKRHLESRKHPNNVDIDGAILWIENIIKLH